MTRTSTSPPTIAVRVVADAAASSNRSVVTREMAYGLSSMFLPAGGKSRPIERAARDEIRLQRLRSGEDLRHRRQVRPFVLAADSAAELDAPRLVEPGLDSAAT